MTASRIIHADVIDGLKSLDEASVDAVVTDPPYGWKFMGKAWDAPEISRRTRTACRNSAIAKAYPRRNGTTYRRKAGQEAPAHSAGEYDRSATANRKFQAWTYAWATEAWRVLKPGGHLLAFCGPRTYHRMAAGVEDAGFEIRDVIAWLFGSGFPKSHNLDGEWEGWGTALKPGFEPVVVARKPLIGTVAANVAEHGTGALHIDACRIDGEKASGSGTPPLKFGGQNDRPFHKDAEPREFDTTKGRWPANVVLDEEAGGDLDEQTGDLKSGAMSAGTKRAAQDGPGSVCYGTYGGDTTKAGTHGDSGGASRFFYCAKASKLDRGPKNTHPTVKPVALMRWLIALVTRPGALIVDPFMGSGTTLVAAAAEHVRCIGIEREQEYVDIARSRLEQGSFLFGDAS